MNRSLIIRQEQPADFDTIRRIVKEAFACAEHTDGDEHNLVDRLRLTGDYIPELSLIAEINGTAAGHIMFSRIFIDDAEAIALAPLSVLPAYQKQHIGQTLIHAAHQKAKALVYSCSTVLGSPAYYPKCGYQPARTFGIIPPFEVPEEFYMVCPLNAPVPQGVVRYSPAFGI